MFAAASKAGLTFRRFQYIRAFLGGRTYSTSVGGVQALSFPVGVGVSQGVVLSPLPFTLVLADQNPRLDNLPGVRPAIYADDTAIWTTGGQSCPQPDSAQEVLGAIKGFLVMRGITFSPEKTQWAVLGKTIARREVTPCIDHRLVGKTIQDTNVLRVIGVNSSPYGHP